MKLSDNSSLMKSCFKLWICLLLSLIVISLAVPASLNAQKGKIAFFGSSVANGSGDTTGAGGYAGIVGALLEKRGWSVVNLSKGGDNTTKILPRFEVQLLPEKPDYVIIGLSLGNEGIATSSELNRNRNFEKYRSGMLHLIRLCRDNGMSPVVVNCYARGDFQAEEYKAVKRMNLIINTWDVPSVSVLGTIDNGKGNWLEGFSHDKSHPDFKGHQEMAFAFVPGLFDAIGSGKTVPYKIRSKDYLMITRPASSRPLSYVPDAPVHSFSVSFLVKSDDEGTIAAINCEKGSFIKLAGGKVAYQSIDESVISADTAAENKGWQYIVLTYQYATCKTSFYVNGSLAGSVTESIELEEIIIGGPGISGQPAPEVSGYKDILVFRSVLNEDEVIALYYDQLLQSSLEIYAPLNDPEFRTGTCAANYAQSLSRLVIDGDYEPVTQK